MHAVNDKMLGKIENTGNGVYRYISNFYFILDRLLNLKYNNRDSVNIICSAKADLLMT